MARLNMATLRLLVSVLAVCFMWNSSIASTEPTASEKAAMATVAKVHPDWREVTSSENFKQWLAQQPEHVRGVAQNSWEPSQIISLFDRYKGETRTTETPKSKQAGLAAYDRGDYSTAFSVWLPHALAGDADSQMRVGLLFDLGRGVAKDERRAAEWYRRAAEQGHRVAQLTLGTSYDNGIGVSKDERLAYAWLRRAAEQGSDEAQARVAAMLGAGRGVTKNERQAAAWLRRAAEQGHTAAQLLLGLYFQQGKGVPVNLERAYFWLILASVDGGEDGPVLRDKVEAKLSRAQRESVQTMAATWRAKPEAGK